MNWKEIIGSSVEEESHDYEKYMTAATEAEKDGCHETAGVLRDIAHEEKIHKKLLAEMLHE